MDFKKHLALELADRYYEKEAALKTQNDSMLPPIKP
jgi:hypothetical protein